MLKLHQSSRTQLTYKARDIWWTTIGHNLGDEEDGKGALFSRPVLVLKTFNRHLFWGIPLSTVQKNGKYYYQFTVHGKHSTALLSQLRIFDTKRLLDRYGMINQDDFRIVKKKVIGLLE